MAINIIHTFRLKRVCLYIFSTDGPLNFLKIEALQKQAVCLGLCTSPVQNEERGSLKH